MATRMQQRRGTYQQWFDYNPILSAAEIGWESDTNKFKIGDGINHWNDLSYFLSIDTLGGSLDDYIPLTSLGAANGVAQLNAQGKLVSNQIPNIDEITQDAIDSALVAGNGITKSYDDNANTITVSVDTSVVATKSELAEAARDAIGSALTAGTGITVTPNDGADTITVAVTSNTYDTYGAASTAASNAATALSNHEADTTNIHGITDTSKLVTTDGTQTLTNKTITSPSGLVKADVGLSNVDNTADMDKPVSTAVDSALDLKADLAGASFSGNVETTGRIVTTNATAASSASTGALVITGGLGVGGDTYVGGDLTITGDFTVNGTTTTVNTQDLVVSDPLIYVGDSNTGNSIDLGIVASFNDGAYQHTGLVRDASAGTWKLFRGVTDEPTTTINFSQGLLDDLAVGGLTATSLTVGDISNTELGYLNGVTSSIQDQLDAKVAKSGSTMTGALTLNADPTNNLHAATKQYVDSAKTAAETTASGALSTHELDASTHGVSGQIVGTTDTQTLTNKTISYLDNTITVHVANITDLTATASELNTLDGITATTAELNTLDGITATVNELNVLDGIMASTAELNILDGVTASTSEINILDGLTVSTTEINRLSGISSGVQGQLDAKAPLASPALTGTPTAPTATAGTNSTQIATTAFVDAAIEALASRSLILDGGGV